MLKDWLKELFGVVFYGLTFERWMWVTVAVLGAVSLVRMWLARQKQAAALAEAGQEDKPAMGGGGDASFTLVGGVAMVGAGLWFGYQAWFDPGYRLFFSEPLVLHTYGMAIAVGFIVSIWLAAHEARRIGLEASRILDLAFWVLLSAMAGSRLLYMLVEWRVYYDRCVDPASQGLSQPDCFGVLRFWEGGLVFQGGLLAATAAGIYYLKKNKLDVWRYADVAVVSVPMGQFFGRLGCLAAGCCHGSYVPSDHWLGLHWGDDTAAWRVIMGKIQPGPEKDLFLSERFVTAYPTQLMESGAMLLLFLALVGMRSRKKFNGQMVSIYMMAYALIRSTIELFRGDDIRGVNELADGFSISTGQIVSMIMFGGGLALWIWRSRVTRGQLSKTPQAQAAA